MRFLLLVTAIALIGCGSSTAPAPKAEESAPAKPAPAKDNTGLLPDAGRENAQVVPDHLLGINALPGGSVATYHTKKRKTYQLFIVETDSNQKAAFALTDLRDALKDPQYIAYMGGFYGTRDGTPIYGFAKLQYLAGVVGLPRDEADPIARELAARLR